MTINRRPLQKRKFNTTFSSKINSKTQSILNGKKGKKPLLKFLMFGFGFFIVSVILIWIYIYTTYLAGLPGVSELENLEIAESSIIYDKNGKELYKIFKEKRTYVGFEKINKNMINALISIEDKRYWTNPGVDVLGLFRAGLNFALGKSDDVKGTSTLTQQLIRNTIIKNEKSVERKIKEMYLAYKLTSTLSKEKILELYLNKISYGNNAYGIEEAAKTYFDKSSKDLSILESSILASLPKGPTYYSPYSHPDRLIGFPYIYSGDKEDEIIKVINQKDKELNALMVKNLTDFISGLKSSRLEGTDKTLICNLDEDYFKKSIIIDGDGCTVIAYSELITFLNSIKIKVDNKYIEYETGRKDRVLGRMLEDKYITFEEYKESVVNAIGYTFNQKRENIKAPHFVFYVKEYLEEKYGKEIVSVGGLKIYTTLDWSLQEKAEELVLKQANLNSKNFGASNAALISIDNKSGGILSMVGGKDYFDNENKGNVNIITSKLQPGSSFKPFVYSIGMFNKIVGTKSPIYDLETKFPGGYNPSNYDGKFMGKMNISTALNNSRNIPALKMFYLAGGEKNIVAFMKKIGVNSLKTNGTYGASLSLGTGEMTPLELATAYSVFANMGVKKDINPIFKIIDSKGNIIEDNSKQKAKEEQTISEAQAYIINDILSDTSSRPSSWNKYISIKNRLVAAKTGTSTKQYEINGVKQKYPSNLWTAGYTPQITTIVWAGNTDGSQLNKGGDGLNGAGPIWRDYMEFAHKGLENEKWKKPSSVKEIFISEISGLLPDPEKTDKSMIISSLFVNTPTTYDRSYKQVEVDTLCNGKVTEKTPIAAIKKVTVLELNDIDPTNPEWQAPVRQWSKTDSFREKYGIFTDLVTDVTNEECKRSGADSDITIKSIINDNDVLSAGENYIELEYKSINPIIKIEILIDDMIVDEIKIDNKNKGTYAGNIFIPVSKAGKQSKIVFRAVDEQYFSNTVSRNVLIVKKDTLTTKIELINPIDGSITLYSKDYFNLKAKINDNTAIDTINILLDGVIIKSGITDRNIVFPINSEKNMTIGSHIISIEVIDKNGNKTNKDIKVEVIEG
ncbi:MAG: transglycosylase domain-containing protein [Candidatus Gracilibacteria bacterium]|nr:transglycosylase domain-containing protein [Candidatus Gracilibacteria bacterium]